MTAGDTGLPPVYGLGSDGSAILRSGANVTMQELYETVGYLANVTTKNGVDTGLGYGAGSYNPELNAITNTAAGVPNFVNLTIDLGATLTCSIYGDGSDNKNGIIWIAASNLTTINGTITASSKGYNYGVGGAGGGTGQYGSPGLGNSPGQGGIRGGRGGGVGGAGGSPAYGSSDIPLTTWSNLYGSGGGGGGGSSYSFFFRFSTSGGGGGGAAHISNGDSGTYGGNWSGGETGDGSRGGYGSGAIRIYTNSLNIGTGTISANGENGVDAAGGGAASGGGGGSGGTVYIEILSSAILGTNKITSSAGARGASSGGDGYGGAGKQGRIHIVGSYTGSTSDPVIA